MTTNFRDALGAASARRLAAVFLVISTPALLNGCAVSDSDLARWETTLGGPRRLSAVVLFDKYPHALRVQATMSLINMKPRKGKSVGIERLVKGTLVCDPEFMRITEPCMKSELNPETRGKIIADLIPLIVAELDNKPPAPAQKGQTVVDPSFKYKDAAFLMLTYEKTQMIADPTLREQLTSALTRWAMADFERRLNDKNQAFGMEQLLRHIGPSSVVGLPKLMSRASRNLAKMSDLVAKIANKETREAASSKLVEIVRYVSSSEWRDTKLPELKEANRKSGFDPTEDQLQKQLADFQNESVTRVYSSMKKVGGAAVVGYCLDIALDKKQDTKRRQVALAALEGHIDRKNDKQIQKLFAVANSDAPGQVTDQAFRRIRELPRSKVESTLYGFFSSSDWRLRRSAGASILQMSTTEHIGEFLEELGSKGTKNFNLPEAITYGAWLGSLKEGDPKKALLPFMKQGKANVRMSAISYYYSFGNKTQLSEITAFEDDPQRVPKCDEDAKCEYTCLIPAGEKTETKDVKTVGDFVRYCIKPKMQKTEPDKSSKKKDVGSKKKGGKYDK